MGSVTRRLPYTPAYGVPFCNVEEKAIERGKEMYPDGSFCVVHHTDGLYYIERPSHIPASVMANARCFVMVNGAWVEQGPEREGT